MAGGIEASLRRLSHYDYWADCLRPSIIMDADADIITYGMGEKPVVEIARRLEQGERIGDIKDLMQSVVIVDADEMPEHSDENNIILHPFEECLKTKTVSGRKLQAHRAAEQPYARRHSVATPRQQGSQGKSHAPSHDHGGG